MKNIHFVFVLIALTIIACGDQYVKIPPDCIGMVLTPTGYNPTVLTPGQVNIGDLDSNQQGNSLVLIERNAVEVKESFAKIDDPKADPDVFGDHRCLAGKGEPISFDVRPILALPDHTTSQGKKDLDRIFLLGKPVQEPDSRGRVMRISSASIYKEQVRPLVRQRIREICSGYEDYNAMFDAFKTDGKDGLAAKINRVVAEAMRDKQVPLALINASPSNIMPDPAILSANVNLMAAEKQIEAIGKMVKYLDEDKTGSRRLVYQNQVLERIAAVAASNGHNTIMIPYGMAPPVPLIYSK